MSFLVKLLHPLVLVGAERYPGGMMSGVKLSRSTSVLRCKVQFPDPDRILPSPGASVAISDCFICGGLLPGGAVASEGPLPRCRIREKRSYLLFSSLEQASVPQKPAHLLFAQVWAARRVGVLCLCCLSFHGEMKENVSGNKDKRHARGFLRPTTSCAGELGPGRYGKREAVALGVGGDNLMDLGTCCPGPAPKRLVWGC